MKLGIWIGSAVALFLASLVGVWLILAGEGLDRAEKWISIGGVCLTVVLSAAGLALGWKTSRQQATDHRVAPPVTAGGAGGVGVGGNNDGEITTEVSGDRPSRSPLPGEATGVRAAGTGSVAVGGDNSARINTRVVRVDNTSQP